MPSIEEIEVPENGLSLSSSNTTWDKIWNKCSCCPYGFHIDVEFVQFSKSLLSRQGDVKRVQALKDKWRSERQSMDQLLGANGVESKRNSHIEKRSSWSRNIPSSNGLFIELAKHVHSELKSISDEEPFDNGLEAAEAEFDLALLRAQTSKKSLAYEREDSQKFHTFPRIKAPFGRKVINDSPIIPKRDHSQRSSIRELVLMSEGSDVDLFKKDPSKSVDKENGSDKHDFKDLEELQEKIRTLTRENWKLKCEKLATQGWNEQEKLVRNSINRMEPADIDELAPLEKSDSKPKTRDVYVEAIARTKEVGVNKNLPQTRSIGIGGIGVNESIYLERRREEPSSPTGSISGTLRRKLRTFDIGVQINECDLQEDEESSPLLQIVERIDAYAQTTFEDIIERKKYKEVGSLAKAMTFDFGMTVKPDVHNAMCGMETSTKSVKVQTDTEITFAEEISEKISTQDLQAISVPLDISTERRLSPPPSSAGDAIKSVTVSRSVEDGTDFPKMKPKSKLPKSIEIEKYPSESGPKASSRIPRLSPGGLKSPAKQEYDWPVASSPPTSERDETPSPTRVEKPVLQRSDTFTKEDDTYSETSDKELPPTPQHQNQEEFKTEAVPSKEMQGALKVLNDALLRGRTTQNVTSAIGIILHEWFRVSGTKTANPHDVEDYLDNFENYSPQILRYIVNMPDGNGNTAMHYAVSHGNFDVVSILLDSRVCDPNKANKAGYTSVMLVALAKVVSDTHRHVVRRLFSMGDVNTKAAQHGQTALMLAASHGRLDTVKLLLEAGAEINLQDEDGSTALMCASEHGHVEIVRYLLSRPECNPNLTDNDGSTALSVAMEAGNKDIGVMLYAQMNFPESPTDSSPRRIKSEDNT